MSDPPVAAASRTRFPRSFQCSVLPLIVNNDCVNSIPYATNNSIHKGIIAHLLPDRRNRSVSTQHRGRVGQDEELLLNGLQNRLMTSAQPRPLRPRSARQVRATDRVLEQGVSAEQETAERVANAAGRVTRSEDHVSLTKTPVRQRPLNEFPPVPSPCPSAS